MSTTQLVILYLIHCAIFCLYLSYLTSIHIVYIFYVFILFLTVLSHKKIILMICLLNITTDTLVKCKVVSCMISL